MLQFQHRWLIPDMLLDEPNVNIQIQIQIQKAIQHQSWQKYPIFKCFFTTDGGGTPQVNDPEAPTVWKLVITANKVRKLLGWT